MSVFIVNDYLTSGLTLGCVSSDPMMLGSSETENRNKTHTVTSLFIYTGLGPI